MRPQWVAGKGGQSRARRRVFARESTSHYRCPAGRAAGVAENATFPGRFQPYLKNFQARRADSFWLGVRS